MRKIRLAHPGELLFNEFIKPNHLTISRVAKEAGIPQPTLQLIVSGRRSIRAAVALRLGIYFGIDAQFWMNLQGEYDLRLATEKLSLQADAIHPLKKAA